MFQVPSKSFEAFGSLRRCGQFREQIGFPDVYMPRSCGSIMTRAFKDIGLGLFTLQTNMMTTTNHMTGKRLPSHCTFTITILRNTTEDEMLKRNDVYSFVRLDGKQPELHLVFNIWEERENTRPTLKKEEIFAGMSQIFFLLYVRSRYLIVILRLSK
jgi:hypothetical protein